MLVLDDDGTPLGDDPPPDDVGEETENGETEADEGRNDEGENGGDDGDEADGGNGADGAGEGEGEGDGEPGEGGEGEPGAGEGEGEGEGEGGAGTKPLTERTVCESDAAHGSLVTFQASIGERTLRVIRPGRPREAEWAEENQLVMGTDGDDRLAGVAGDDVLCGLGGNDALLGNQGDDDLFGGPGRDELRGQDGNDRLIGTLGEDLFYGGHGDGGELQDGTPDAVNYCSGAGTACRPLWTAGDFDRADFDRLLAEAEALCGAAVGRHGEVYHGYRVYELARIERDSINTDLAFERDKYNDPADNGPNIVVGTDADEVFHGLGGDDILCGGGGRDELGGNDGHDILIGGEGADIFNGGAGDDVVDSQQEDLVPVPGGLPVRGGPGVDYCREVVTDDGDTTLVRDCDVSSL
ncbi:MAG: calcium-binding protein [Actinomycetota bacterium]